MKRYKLTQKVVVSGPNFFGFQSHLSFTPHNERGWWWELEDGTFIPIDHRIASCKKGRIVLGHKNQEINVWEHIGFLRFLGWDSISIKIENPPLVGKFWPPYLGGARGYISQLKDFFVPEEGEIGYTSPSCPSVWIKGERKVSITNNDVSTLRLSISSQWKPLIPITTVMQIDYPIDIKQLSYVIDSRPQGYPHSLKHVAKFLIFFGWKNYENVSWMGTEDHIKIAFEWHYHRLQDSLGGLSLSSHYLLPKGIYDSIYGGHAGDLSVMRNSFPIY